jgi:hypothetical protein
MLFATLCASSLGWAHVTVAVVGGFAVSHLYMHVFRMWVEIALLGPLLAVASVFRECQITCVRAIHGGLIVIGL